MRKALRSPIFQDNLFSSVRVVERTLDNGTVLRLVLEPCQNECVRVLEYHRCPEGGRWSREASEEGRTLAYRQLKLPRAYTELFATSI